MWGGVKGFSTEAADGLVQRAELLFKAEKNKTAYVHGHQNVDPHKGNKGVVGSSLHF